VFTVDFEVSFSISCLSYEVRRVFYMRFGKFPTQHLRRHIKVMLSLSSFELLMGLPWKQNDSRRQNSEVAKDT